MNRHEVYKTMLDVYRIQIENENSHGFCAILEADTFHDNISQEQSELLSSINMEDLSELLSYKPKQDFYDYTGEPTSYTDQFWFSIRDTETRIKILEECIEATK